MRAILLAYHTIGCVGIRKVLEAGLEIAAVFTHRDDPSETVWFDSVADLCVERGIETFAPEDINDPVWVERIRHLRPDLLFSFYYRRMIRRPILAIPRLGCFNLHGSLLPKYRGRAPVNWAVIRGERETGVTLHHMTEAPDAGDIVAQRAFPIGADDTARDVHRRAAREAGLLLEETLPRILTGTAPRVPQDPAAATYFHGRKPADGQIRWEESAEGIRNLVRGVTWPYPGAFGWLSGSKVTIWNATVLPCAAGAAPGTVLAVHPPTIACGCGALRIEKASIGDGAPLSGTALAENSLFQTGAIFGAAGEAGTR